MRNYLMIVLILGFVNDLFSQIDSLGFDKPLFDYQNYALKMVKKRNFYKMIYEYDSLNNVTRSFSFNSYDSDINESIKQKKLNDVTTFPYFTINDSLIKISEDSIYIFYSIITKYQYLNYYLKDLNLPFNKEIDQIDKIEGKLIIHGSSIYQGDYSYDENYVATFGKAGKYYLPEEIKYYPIEDTDFKQPRIVEKIKYKIK